MLSLMLLFSAIAGCGHSHDSGPAPDPVLQTSNDAISTLSGWRVKKALPALTADAGLTKRCDAWVHQMSLPAEGLHLDPAVAGTDERECVIGGGDGDLTAGAALAVMDVNPIEHAVMFDQIGAPTAVLGGFAVYGSYACLRLCPSPHDPRVCNG